ncbi:MAG: type IX secretion system membrane protein PorP/SprF [candidate division KSB1 bacterium]|nr:type IX secretion system membrane protein PorP/SprF [candidate division KSB1 bacterium]MDZ7319088.1 type IX secretion system membrane protein PorP/SprF [candidate division KSB1 bacterium]
MFTWILIVGALLSLSEVYGQGFNINNAADVSHPWISEMNPAVISTQFSRVALGLKVFHFGFIPNQNFAIQESHINASFPFLLPYEIGLGGDLRYFSAGIYSEFSGAVMVSRKIWEQLSLGMKIGFGRFGFAREDFHLVDANDPLLSGNLARTTLNLGVGAFWNSGPWSFGLGVDHLNRPNLGRQTQAILPQEISLAASYTFRNLIPSLMLHHDGNYVRYGLALAVRHERMGLFRCSFENTLPLKLELQVNLSRDNQLHYGLDLPTGELTSVSMGSHEMVYARILGRGPDIGQPEIQLSTDTLHIIQERVVRSMPRELSIYEVEKLAELSPEYLQPKGRFGNALIVPTGVLSQYETQNLRLQRYAKLGREIKRRLQQMPSANLILQADERTLPDARILRQFLIQKGIVAANQIDVIKLNGAVRPKLEGFEPGEETQSQVAPKLSVEKLTFGLQVPGKIRRVKDWELVILNNKKEVVKSMHGNDELPELVDWDWRDKWGELLDSGQYTCSLTINTLNGQQKNTVSQPLQVTRLNRTVYLRFSQEPSLQASKLDR